MTSIILLNIHWCNCFTSIFYFKDSHSPHHAELPSGIMGTAEDTKRSTQSHCLWMSCVFTTHTQGTHVLLWACKEEDLLYECRKIPVANELFPKQDSDCWVCSRGRLLCRSPHIICGHCRKSWICFKAAAWISNHTSSHVPVNVTQETLKTCGVY